MEGLHIHGAAHAYGDNQVLSKISMVVPGGELVCLLGPSGCGKSTLLRLAAGLEVLQEGSIVIDDVTVATKELHVPPEQRRIGLMFQDYALFPHLNVIDNVSFGLLGMARAKARAIARERLDQVELAHLTEAFPHMLSGGMQQRVALARALAPEPKLLLLDEPFSGLDTNMRASIRQMTLNVLKQSGVATLMVTHDPEEAMFMADRIKILGRGGKILQSGDSHEIYYHPNNEFVARLFGFMNTIKGTVQNAMVQTPFGPVPANGFADGEPAQVLIRPEGIVLSSGGQDGGESSGGIPVEVNSTHLLGHFSVASLKIAADRNGAQEFYVRVHKEFLPELAGRITARIDPEQSFVFADDATVPGEPMLDDLNILSPELKTLLSTGLEPQDKVQKQAEAAE
ncbi:MAG: ABC transporter ATP-binding protein [Rhodospirillaceae bacterium]|nr:ABC transporter ATP-binding protein [Rhodospirillaceae bacterium]MBT3887272.1 ABC transporter ATP-binding protein [Rhodospirillaceae bacterium]MBT4117648.1 ABC transporter ATP-binding protein [Rhodospirillaceae bacterium]MBT4670781.1 ABC transporter ATP-binding protein [Rhodospirillaceae bacterium]MBT4718075.1 ABC transporter ATP-binding protein [Rhodospirillaceae bacterium]